jgi:proteasome beta subunit
MFKNTWALQPIIVLKRTLNMNTDILKTGTTTVGIVTKDSIILAADKRATAGSMIMDKNVTKILPINERMLVTIAGVVSDVQLLVKYIKAELKIKDLKTGIPSSVKSAANLLASFNYSGLRGQGSIAHFLLAGADTDGTHLYEVTFDGAVMPVEQYEVTGSGTPFALAVVETLYKKNMTEAEGVELAKRALTASMERDSASGNGYDVYVINKTGAHHKETVSLKSVPQ